MSEALTGSSALTVTSASGMRVDINANRSLRRFDCGSICLNLFIGNEMEGGPTNLYLRRLGGDAPPTWIPLLGPSSPTRFIAQLAPHGLLGEGSWLGMEYRLSLQLADRMPVWFWHLQLTNTTSAAQQFDVTYAQDLALAAYGAVRMNEFYVSQYIDHTPLIDSRRGVMIASRQNAAVDARYPWSLIGSLRNASGYATDAKQFYGLAARSGDVPIGMLGALPAQRLQHEHSMVVLRDVPLSIDAHGTASTGFFGLFVPDHPQATSGTDLSRVGSVITLPEASPTQKPVERYLMSATGASAATLFTGAPVLNGLELDAAALTDQFGASWRHQEYGGDNAAQLQSFFYAADRHVVLKAKELQVQRPHGHLLRTGRHITPDEMGLTSTVWMSGVFHSMLTQGHVSINRFLSTVHSYLGLFRSHGQRVFVELGGQWHLLNVPSAFEMAPDACRWLYRHADGLIEVRAAAHSDPHELSLSITVKAGTPTRFLISHHVALNGDDGSTGGIAPWTRDGEAIRLSAAQSNELGTRFPHGSFLISPVPGARFAQVGGDELLFLDARSRQQPFVVVITAPSLNADLRIRGELIDRPIPTPLYLAAGESLIPTLRLVEAAKSDAVDRVSRLADIVPWLTHNALVHYLSPRGLEQYSGGGWGTRDVCQGPVEMLLALGRTAPIRDLLLRVMRQQNPDGDWPQWFMFFDRERGIRPADSHGDIVFWPLLALAQYLIASGDVALLDEQVPFFDSSSAQGGEQASVWQHVQRSLELIGRRVIAGTALAAYGHGDWNDSLQPADPRLREHMCSAWTVTLHFQMLTTLAEALRRSGRESDAATLQTQAQAVHRDFQRLLLVDGVLAGYALFEQGDRIRYLLHPGDQSTGIHYSALAIIHAILEDMLTPAQTREHLALIDAHLSAVDGVRLFNRPMAYHGGPQRLFQRAETATFFGREIGLMYTHAHLRYAQAMAHIGAADRFFQALCQANPIGIASVVQGATARQANCYYSSSDAAFADRYQADAEYERVQQGHIALDGGWRVYSSGAGITLGLIVRYFLGLSCEAQSLCVDPVMPVALNGLRIQTRLKGFPIEVNYRIGTAGCGVNSVELNGQTLSFERLPNPHRPGAAQVSMLNFTARLTGADNRLQIVIG
jgi:cellobiose phosphorylase